ncbi:hypothetical protein GLOIN_2v1791387 [Rhizophagus irregularis DAOM 181602=DAOM 197198]|uniref:Uncharacterized protein n=1 Tax=Rhizophagus irregularis (strain DAOM 181602 / DAOM 197198 / MUCL 43194) TaxID=747089 RepID=A0A2P4NX68_RHIID|nr:hypothetical protein GLOIN_2v1791387 [Rhizophagus irregularis DAOM 181602=DAOM 197198]POG57735.1 hypothetical protein GLOIN_2v1791387 [Rhizophagus irregularis DAOM 181602=DAOM 197198]GBC11736.2 hypothetical protein GLOIN_2v1791387 [Rhizophagus irregularis DAOM 181602=DAOM 197198]|eukprot:XP_025164601.1 hypothetical protein GLOIN_2v1791387 [Rhizophagus irregularis DAOM 181602=DAOM 197198]
MEEETLKQYLNEYYRGFTGFELEHIEDFSKSLKEYKKFNLEEYKILHLDKDMLYPPGDIKIGVRDARITKERNIYKDILMDTAVFTMKMGGENVKRILETILLENSQASTTTQDGAIADIEKGATTNTEKGAITNKDIDETNFLRHYLLLFYKDFKGFEEHHLDDFSDAMRKNSRVNLAEYELEYMERDIIFPPGIMGEGIINGKRQTGNNIIKDTLMDFATFTMKMAGDTTKKILQIVFETLQKRSAEKNAAVEELQKTKNELDSMRAKYNEYKEKIDNLEKEKKMAEERIKKLENDVLKLSNSEKKTVTSEIATSTYWKDNEIYDSLKQIGYIERLECKWNYKYRTVRARIRFTTEMEEIFIKGGPNIAIKKKEQTYFFRMFNAKMSTTEIKKKYEWQAYKKFKDLPGRPEHEGLKAENLKYGFNESNLQFDDGRRKHGKRFDGFVDATTDLISTVPRTSEEHDELDNLNNKFKERLDELKMTTDTTQRKGKKKVTELSDDDDEEMKNENKKRVVRKQGERENSDTE